VVPGDARGARHRDPTRSITAHEHPGERRGRAEPAGTRTADSGFSNRRIVRGSSRRLHTGSHPASASQAGGEVLAAYRKSGVTSRSRREQTPSAARTGTAACRGRGVRRPRRLRAAARTCRSFALRALRGSPG
jgi:hypothetical protein